MEREAFEEVEIEPQTGWHLRYRLYREDHDGRLAYGLSVEETLNGEGERLMLDDVTDCEETARRVFTLFVEGTVTVCTAEELLFEWLYAP